MKGKKFLALASIFAGAALVGSTFALWAVTDNADPFALTISPGTIASDTANTRVELSYGEKSYANVGNIVCGTQRLAATVDLKATWEANPKDTTIDSSSLTGQFNITLEQAIGGSTKLIDFLNVYVYDEAPTLSSGTLVAEDGLKGNKLGELLKSVSTHTKDISVTLTSAVPHQTVYVIVEYDSSATAADISQVASDQVKMTMNWNKTGSDVVTGTSIYYYGSEPANLYAWKEDKTPNGAYPGIAMTKVRDDGLYEYVLPNDFVGFLITKDADTKFTPEDVVLSEWKTVRASDDKVCFVNDDTPGWKTIPTYVSELTKDYYLVGNFTNPTWKSLETNGLESTLDANVYTKASVELAPGAQFKIVSKNGENWFTNNSVDWGGMASFLTLDGSNLKITAESTQSYDFEFYVSSEQGNHIKVSVHE